MDRKVVARWEALLCDNIVGASRQWYTDMRNALLQAHSDVANAHRAERALTLECHVLSGDATNSSAVQSLKVQACKVVSMCWLGGEQGVLKYTSFCDVQHLPPNCG
eukprot:6546386-Alexandrium_andersonii.AAC.1